MASAVKKSYVWLVAELFLAGVFIVAGILKIPHPDALYASIRGFQLVDPFWSLVGSYIFPWTELWAGIGIIFKKTRAAAASIICALMILFIVVLIQAWLRGLDINCGCFGSDDSTPDSYPALLLRDAGLLILGVFLAFKKEDAI